MLTSAVMAQVIPASSPQMWSSPKQGPPTTNVLLQGLGFDPLTAIDLYFDGAVAASTTTDKNGAFGNGVITATGATVAGLQVPATALPGQHTITAQERVGQKSAQISFLVRTDWAQFHFSADHVGLNPYENVLNPNTVDKLTVRWTFPVSLGIESSPVVVNGTLYFSEIFGPVHAVDANTGTPLWQYSTNEFTSVEIAATNSVVYLVPCDLQHVVCALNASNGSPLWSFPLTFEAGAPVLANGVLYLGAQDGNVYALNATTGTLLWKYHAGYEVEFAPAVANGVVYEGSDDGNIYALNANTGALIWKTSIGSCAASSPSVGAGLVFVSPCDAITAIYALDANTGTIVWKSAVGPGYGSTPAVANGLVYDIISDGSISAFDVSTGTLRWRYPTGYVGNQGPAVVIANGVAYLAWSNDNIYALDAITGALLWDYSASPPNTFYSTPAIVNGMLYVGSATGNTGLYAFGLPSGQKAVVPLR